MKKLSAAWLVAVFAVSGCGSGVSDPQGKATAEWALGLGGTVTLAGNPREIKTKADLPSSAIAVERIVLNDTRVTDDDLRKLAASPNLKYLGLYNTEITDDGLEHLTGLDSLTELELSYTLVTNRGILKLGRMPRLKKVYLYGTGVSDQAVATLENNGCRVYR